MRISSFVPSEEIFNNTMNITSDKVDNNDSGKLFSNALKTSLDKINEQQVIANEATNAFVRGEDVDISEVMLKGAEASVSLQFAVQVRNKLVEAYQEISRMQL